MHEGDGKYFDYMIADYHLPWNEIPEGYEIKVIPAGTPRTGVFGAGADYFKSLQDVNKESGVILSAGLPGSINLQGNYNVEMYTPQTDYPDDYYCEMDTRSRAYRRDVMIEFFAGC